MKLLLGSAYLIAERVDRKKSNTTHSCRAFELANETGNSTSW